MDLTDVVDVISDFVTLKRRGANHIACCPFHNEKTPSFSVSQSKGIYKCFGCGKAGNAVSFLMDHESLSYKDAIKYLGKKYGVEIIEEDETAEDIEEKTRKESLIIVSEFANNFFQNCLINTEVGQTIAYSYFTQVRGFTKETIKKFQLGYAPSRESFRGSSPTSLVEAATKAGYKKDFLLGAGLCIESNNGGLLDKFHDRIMFPIHTLSGRVIAFGGRTMKTEKSIPKYLNSPETEIYHKSSSLYGLYYAKSAISRNGKCYLVEGYTDVISFHQAGIENVVSSSGTSLTSEQIRLIKRFTNKVTVLYDGDPAGIKASLRGIDMLLSEGLEIKVALFPDGEDPDSFARSHSKEEIENFLDTSEIDFISFKHNLIAGEIGRDPIRKAELIREIIRTISLIPDQVVRTVYIEETASKLNVRQEMLIQEVSKARRDFIASGEYEKKREAERIARLAEREAAQTPRNTGAAFDNTVSNRSIGPTSVGNAGNVSRTPNDIPPPPEDEYYYGSDNSAQNYNDVLDNFDANRDRNYSVVDHRPIEKIVPLLQTVEKEIIYYLLKFGETPIKFEEHMYIDSEAPIMQITVSQYISGEMITDDIELLNSDYKRVYDLYFSFLAEINADSNTVDTDSSNSKESNIQSIIQQRFFNHTDQAVRKTVLDIIFQEHTINVKEYIKSLIPEENILGVVVPKTVLIFKSKLAEHAYQLNLKKMKIAQESGDDETQNEIMKQMKILMIIKNQFAKELKRLT